MVGTVFLIHHQILHQQSVNWFLQSRTGIGVTTLCKICENTDFRWPVFSLNLRFCTYTENKGQRKPVCLHILRNINQERINIPEVGHGLKLKRLSCGLQLIDVHNKDRVALNTSESISTYSETLKLRVLRASNVDSYICDAFHDLVPFAQFKKLGKHIWKCVTFIKVAGFSLQLY